MRVRWTTDAADDLERICDYIARDRPDFARRVAQSVVERIGSLETFPRLGALAASTARARSRFLRFLSSQ
jgi:plasmid stabilization system protein ParE